ncbi:MAG: hypothetical protein RI897_2843 [Verrucomicrobiota bacterium]|jgi:PAS domain S-box-containing protein
MNSESIRVLVVDDEPAHLEAICRALEEWGDGLYEVRDGRSLADFRRVATEWSPQLVVMDMVLPDGRAETVLVSPPEQGVAPIILMTSYGDEATAVDAIKRGAMDYIVKSPEVFAMIPRVLERTLKSWQLLQERSRAEEALRTAVGKYKALFEAFPMGITVMDGEGGVVETNSVAEEYLGLSREGGANGGGWGGWPMVKRDGNPMSAEEFADAIGLREGKRVQHAEIGVVRPDDTVGWMSVTAAPVGLPGLGKVVTYADVTAQRRAEEALRRSEQEFRSLFMMASVGMAQADPGSRRFTRVNARMCVITGYRENELLGMTIEELTHPDDRERDAVHVRKLLEGIRGEYQAEKRYLRKGGGEVWVNVNATLIRDGAGNPYRMMATIEDITGRQRALSRARRDTLLKELLLELHQQEGGMTDKELYDYVLDKAVGLTESRIGFFHKVSEDEREIILTTWNAAALKNCTAVYDNHYPLREAGNWVDCVRQRKPVVYNDYEHSPNQRGLPAGHAVLKRFMSIPVVSRDRVRIIFGVGNKGEDYTDEDVSQLQLVANEMHKIMVQREAGKRLRLQALMLDQIHDSVTVTDTHGKILYLNRAMMEVLKRSESEVLGHTVMEYGVYGGEQLERTLVEGYAVDELVGEDGRGPEQVTEVRTTLLRDTDGSAVGVCGVGTEVTLRRRADKFRQALLAMSDQLNQTRSPVDAGRALLNAAERLWHWDAAELGVFADDGTFGTVIRVGTEGGVKREYPDGEILRGGGRVERVRLEGGQLFRGEEVEGGVTMSVPVRRGDAIIGVLALHSVSADGFHDEDLETLQALADYGGGALDRIRAGQALAQSELRYRTLLETAFDWVWEVDRQGRYTYASPRVRDLLGYEPGEVVGRTAFDLMTETEAVRMKKLFGEIVLTQKPFSNLENVCRHKKGNLVTMETSGAPVFGEEGELLGYRGMDRDITERKQLEMQLRQAQKLEAIGQLAGGVAHDYNNILAAIMMHLGLLQGHEGLDEETRQALVELDSEARRAANLTRQLLMFSRRSVLSVKPLDLNDVVANLLKMLRRLIGEHYDLRFDGKSVLARVEADAGMIEQVLMNLVVNARDSMPRGGRITIATSMCEGGRGVESLAEGGSVRPAVCLSVKDEGVGMDEMTRRRIFEPFFTTKEPGKGTGLGLATVHGIVAQHKGWVEVESELGSGSTFQVYLPSYEGVEERGEDVSGEGEGGSLPRGQETVLLVEDDARVRQMVAQSLRSLGYRVHEARTGSEAIHWWQGRGAEADLLFTDMVMPGGMTGLELALELRSLRPGLRVLISSGYSSEFSQGVNPVDQGFDYLPKPYELEKLAHAVRGCLDKR